MPIEFFTSLERDLVYARWWGIIDLHDFRTSFASYLADRNYKAGRSELVNLSEVTRVDLDFQRVKMILHEVNDQVPGAKVHTRTVLWAPDDDTYATGRMYQQLADYAGGITVEIYREECEALAVYKLPFSHMAQLAGSGGFLPADLRPSIRNSVEHDGS